MGPIQRLREDGEFSFTALGRHATKNRSTCACCRGNNINISEVEPVTRSVGQCNTVTHARPLLALAGHLRWEPPR